MILVCFQLTSSHFIEPLQLSESTKVMTPFASPLFQLNSTQTALAFIVPAHLSHDINALRKIHDTAYRKWDPHINVLYPFVEPTHLDSAIATLRECLNNNNHVEGININTSEVGLFKHRKNATIFLRPGPEANEGISELRRVLVHALGCDEKSGTRDGTFRPHMTIGQAALNGTSIDKLVNQVEKLIGIEWRGTKLAILRRATSGEMRLVGELPLGSAQDDCTDRFIDTEWRRCYTFNANSYWQTSSMSETSISKQDPLEVQICTYNLMAESGQLPFHSRFPHIIQAISSSITQTSSIKVLCLQEIDDAMLPLLLSNEFIQKLYPFSTHTPLSLLPSHRNLVTFASAPFDYFTLQFRERHKSALVISFHHLQLEVVNIHLTKSLSHEAVKIKMRQMATVTDFINCERRPTEKEVIIAGDFNITTSSRTIQTALAQNIISDETVHLMNAIIDSDVWEDTFIVSESNTTDRSGETFEGEARATFDRLNNSLAAASESPVDDRPQRYDRVLFRKGGGVHIKSYQIIGRPDSQGHCGSDHYGVSATVCLSAIDKMSNNIAHPNPSPLPLNESTSTIDAVTDSYDPSSLIKQFLPTAADREQREQALEILKQTLTSNEKTSKLVLTPLGSYFMGTYFADSDIDILAIGEVPPHFFFNNVIDQLRKLDASGNGGFQGLHFINAVVSIVEVCVMGIKFDLQYCQAAELLERYYLTASPPNLATLVFNKEIISSLPPSSIRPLNTFRDTAYLLESISDLESYRTAHRFLSLYLRKRGLYSAKFGYLGGIHLSLMLNRVLKLITADTQNVEGSNVDERSNSKLLPASIVLTFFKYYAAFNWREDNVTDPSLSDHKNISRSPRDAIFICSIHTPTARLNVAQSCTSLTAQTLVTEFSLALNKLQMRDWEWCLRPSRETVNDFLNGFGAFICVQIDMWAVYEFERNNMREIVGSIESKFPRLMTMLGQLKGLEGRIWPARFRVGGDKSSADEPKKESQGRQFKCVYLIGVSIHREEMDSGEKELFTGKVISAVREHEKGIRESREFSNGNMWVTMELIPRKKVLGMGLIIDDRD
ncbi:2'-5' RNA ligase superfamily-domain-containing protein [Xylogone sp. PMI_703]|nr:2'-5' RNA ligase superfamily-domain-containing protein [Xylogone sp. PMI_703]